MSIRTFLQKAVSAVKALLMMAVVLIFALLVIEFFNETFFNLEGLFYLCLGFLLLWSNFQQKPDSTADLCLDSLALPFQLIMIYGAVGMMLLSGLGRMLPETWQWPVDEKSSLIVFDNGQKAVLLDDFPRIQVYDRMGRYLGGWFIDTGSSVFTRARLFKNNYGAPGEEETILIHSTLAPKVDVYNLSGLKVGEKERHYESVGWPDHTAADFPETFPVAWYMRPLVSELNSVLCMLVGMVGTLLLQWMHRLFRPRSQNLPPSSLEEKTE